MAWKTRSQAGVRSISCRARTPARIDSHQVAGLAGGSQEGRRHEDLQARPTAIRAGMPAALAIATYSAVCSLQSPIFVRRTSRAEGRLIVGFLSSRPLTYRRSR